MLYFIEEHKHVGEIECISRTWIRLFAHCFDVGKRELRVRISVEVLVRYTVSTPVVGTVEGLQYHLIKVEKKPKSSDHRFSSYTFQQT